MADSFLKGASNHICCLWDSCRISEKFGGFFIVINSRKGMSRQGSAACGSGSPVLPASTGMQRSASKVSNTQSTQRSGSLNNDIQSPCHLCAGPQPINGSTRLCAACSKPAHLACMLRRFKESGNDNLRNGVDWLLDFLEFSSLHYVCLQCSKINCGKGM